MVIIYLNDVSEQQIFNLVNIAVNILFSTNAMVTKL